MKAAFIKAAVRLVGIGPRVTLLKAAVLVVAVGATGYGGPVTIFWDDFADQTIGTNPGPPPVGQPWQISEIAPDGVDVAVDPFDPANNVLQFGRYRNQAIVPFSTLQQQQIEAAGNASLSFSYTGFSSGGYSQYFDVGGYDGPTGDPAFFVRMLPQEDQSLSGYHDVYYLDPAGGLIDSGIDVETDTVQSVTITSDFASGTFDLGIEGDSATLPMFRCPSTIIDVQFNNYGVFMGSGLIDDVSVTVDEPGAEMEAHVPEMATTGLLVVGGAVFAWFWVTRRRTR